MLRALLCILAGPALAGCGSDSPPAAGPTPATDAAVKALPVLPWKVNNSWTYRVTEAGVTSTKVTTIGAEEVVGGTGPHRSDLAYQVVTEKRDGTDKTVSWQRDDNGKVIRYREQAFSAKTGELAEEEHWDPYKLHIDGTAAHCREGATWLETYQETKLPAGGAPTTAEQRDRWVVDAVGATVTVPAGTFEDAIIFQKSGNTTKSYWYVRGVGKIKETGTQTEELVEYEIQR